MSQYWIIFIGSGIGGMLRYMIGRWVNHHIYASFPFGTFVVNILACLMLGLVLGLAEQKQWVSPSIRLGLGVGFCGGFSTFSTFGYETLTLLNDGSYLTALAYVLASVLIGILATMIGVAIARY